MLGQCRFVIFNSIIYVWFFVCSTIYITNEIKSFISCIVHHYIFLFHKSISFYHIATSYYYIQTITRSIDSTSKCTITLAVADTTLSFSHRWLHMDILLTRIRHNFPILQMKEYCVYYKWINIFLKNDCNTYINKICIRHKKVLL